MAIPDFQSIMLPLLIIARDQKEMLPRERQARFDNRVAWARAYLKKADLIENSGRGIFHITGKGLELLKRNPSRIDIKLLKQYPPIRDWHSGSSRKGDGVEADLQDGGNEGGPESQKRHHDNYLTVLQGCEGLRRQNRKEDSPH